MQLTELQKAAAQAIVNVHETNSVRGDYGNVTCVKGDPGHLTYGRSQTTLASGNLAILLDDYCKHPNAAHAEELRPYLQRCRDRDLTLDNDEELKNILRACGNEPVMWQVQDAFFDRVYWEPAMERAAKAGLSTPLGAAITYDSYLHGSWARMRDRVYERHGRVADLGESKWLSHYVDERRDWLANHSKPILRKTIYRMDTFKKLIGANNWDLLLPFGAHGRNITLRALEAPVCVPLAPDAPKRRLRLQKPSMQGDDVSWIQLRLFAGGYHVQVTWIFDEQTDKALKAFQKDNALTPDGIAGPQTIRALNAISPMAPLQITLTANIPELHIEEDIMDSEHQKVKSQHPQNNHASARDQELKRHVSHEIQSGIRHIQASIQAEHRQLAMAMAESMKQEHKDAPRSTSAFGRAEDLIRQVIAGKRSMVASAVSAGILFITQIRDAIVPPGVVPGSFAGQVQTTRSDLHQWFGGLYETARAAAMQLPDDWTYRLRVGALILIGYVFYRHVIRRYFGNKLRKLLLNRLGLSS